MGESRAMGGYCVMCLLLTLTLAFANGQNCDFDTGLSNCNYAQSRNDTFDWTRSQGPTSSSNTGPRMDHTSLIKTRGGTANGAKCAIPFTYRGTRYNSCTRRGHTQYWCSTTSVYTNKWGNCGYYMFVETSSPRRAGDKAVLFSKTIPSGQKCLKFFYHMYGAHVDTLNVYVTPNSTLGSALWSKTGSKGNTWQNASVQFSITQASKVAFQGVRGRSYQGDMAIDDVTITNGSCSSSGGVCTFQTDICGFVQEKSTDQFDWIRRRGRTPSSSTGPSSDHTTGSPTGYYFYVESSSPRTRGDKGRISKQYSGLSSTGSCLTFWYHMFGYHTGSLNIYMKSLASSALPNKTAWSMIGQQGNQWLKGQTTIANSSVNVVFEGVIGTGYRGDMAIDDISIQPGKCVSPGACDFQNNFCTWYNVRSGDEFDWIRGSGGTPSSVTGPSRDRKGNANGKYVFIESSAPRSTGDKAFLISPLFNRTSSTGRCFTFWYHMYGSSIGTLHIYMNSTNAAKKLVWSLSGNKGNNWFNGQVNVGTSRGTYQVIIEGIRGSSYTGDIAVDDFEFRDGSCSTVPSSATPGTVVTTRAPTTPTPTPTPTSVQTFDCNFEQGICSPLWNQDRSTDDLDWKRQRGGTPSSGTGPTTDHTTKSRTGYYIYVEVSGQRLNKTARLISQSIPGTAALGGRCLRFWYHMYGPHVNTLNVYVKTGSHLGSAVWRKSGTQGNQWKSAWATLYARTHFQIVLEGLTGSGYRGDIAIDDITLRPGPCTVPTATCTFEDANNCGYTHSDAVDFKWTKGSGSTTSSGTGPRTDHTTNSSAGFYMYTESSSPRSRGDKAHLISPTNPRTSGSCLEFWYHMYGGDIGRLNIYARTGNTLPTTPIWGESGNKGNQWKVAKVSVTTTSAFELVFEGIIGSGYRGDISVDDIKLTKGVCSSPGYCDFENGLCTWTQTNTDDFDWLRGRGGTPSSYTGPAVDHTTGNGTGYYMFIEASSPRRTGHKARLVSEQFNNIGSTPRCLTFWYHMYGSAIGSLRVIYKVQSGTKRETLLWNLTGQQQPSRTSAWKYGSTPVKVDTDHTIIFEGVRGSSYQGDIAVDDIQITRQACVITPAGANPNGAISPSPTTPYPRTLPTTIPTGTFNCNFESGFCQYAQDSNDRFNWTRFQGYTHSAGTGPSMDHTRGKGAVGPKGPGSLAHVGGKCLHVLGGAHSKPRNDQPLVTYDGCGQDRLEFVLGSDGYLRHTKYNQCVRPAGSRQTEGTFVGVSNSCGVDKWRIIGSGIFQHIPSSKCLMPYRKYQNPPNQNKLIITSTCNQFKQKFTWLPTMGWFAFIESSSPRKQNDTARLISKTQVTQRGQCLNFWYHMYGAHVNQLNVYLNKSGNAGRPVWSKYGSHGDVWKPAHVYMSAAPPFKIVIEAVRGNGYQGDIAIDDIQVTNGCPAPKECTFEETNPLLCGWRNIAGDNFDWSRATGSTASTGTGPRNDHTYGNNKGYYMYIETSGRIRNGWKAWLQSPQYTPGSGKCLQFWYHMYGSSIGTLNVYIKTGSSLPRTASWTRGSTQGNQWLIGQVSVTQSSQFAVVFEGIRGRSYTGDIAIDDVKMFDGICNLPAACDFENDRCTWSDTKLEDDYDWTVNQGGTATSRTGPSADHTKRNGDGHYIYLETSSPRKLGDKARYLSERFPATQSGVTFCLKFWYHMYGSSIGTLNILIKSGAGNTSLAEKIVWSLSGNKGQQWRYGAVPITSRNGFQMVIEGIRGTGYGGDISVDDISYTRSSCRVQPSTAVPRPPTTAPPVTVPTTPAAGMYKCNFENNWCSWQQDLTDNFNWTRHRGKTSSTDTGPSTDHTVGTVNGTYVYIEASSPRQVNDKARLISARIAADGRMGHCVKFWFHMFGPHVKALNIYLKQGSQLNGPVWKRLGNNGNKWRSGQVSVSSNVPYSVVFEGVRGTSYNGDISLDDVDIIRGTCPAAAQCDFEHGLCGFTQDKTDNFDWTRRRGRTPSVSTGPSADHTLETNQGYYLYTEASGRRSGQKARMLTAPYTKTTSSCLEFWYHLYGYHIGTLNVYSQMSSSSGTSRSIIWSKSGNHGNQWNIARTTVSGGSGRRIVFEGVRGRGYQGDIALDDISMTDGNCPPPGHCTFEAGDFCTWSNPQTGDDFDWIIGSGGTPSYYTGPQIDHTTGQASGSYAYIETSSPRKQGETAQLISESFSPTSSRGRCLKFWYHMKGGDIGTLNVYTRTQNGTKIKFWTLQQQQGANWLYGQGPIRSTVDYQVIFEGIRGNGFAGDIALDDIEFVNFACSNLPAGSVPQVPPTTQPPTRATSKPPTPAPSVYNCNFTLNMCSWKGDPTGKFNWTRHQGSTGSYLTGPTEDHTSGTAAGWYIFIETSYPRRANDTARLLSAPVPSTRQKCLQFWYHMYGDHVDNLTVYIKRSSAMLPIFFKRGTQGNRWRHATVDVISNSLFQIVFEGVRGMSYRGDIAIDDISLNDGRCPPQAECTFEDPNSCGWQNMAGDNFDWTRASAATASYGTGPSNDHTYGSRIGYYMYIESSSPRTKGHRAWLRSKQFPATTGKCLQFWYHMYGSTIGKLNVLYYKNGTRSSPIWTLSGNQGNQWRIAQVTLTSRTNYQIIFDATTGASYTGDIAIDDVLFKDGACPLPGNCNFETGMCTYVNTFSGDEFDWTIGSGGTVSTSTGPSTDHTTSSRTGRYLFIETSWPRMPNERARVESEVISGRRLGSCVSFWYHMKGAHIGSLNVYMKIFGQSQSIIWSLKQHQGTGWLSGQAPLLSGGKSFQVVFEGIRGQDYQGDIAIDDISVTDLQGSCSIRPANAVPWGCNFEQNNCKWTQATDDKFNWRRYRGSTSSTGTGPRSDHTTGTRYGYYNYIETSSPRRANDTARLLSPTLTGNGTALTHCVKFYYHMYGPHVNTLKIFTKKSGRYSPALWIRNGTQGPNWRYGEVSIRTTDDIQVVFEGKRGISYQGDIAIDDIDLEYGDCPSSGVCTFEGARICGWYQSTSDNFDWVRASSGTSSVGTGPKFDHTYGTKFGHYMYIETSSPRVQGNKAVILTPYFPNSGTKCIRFYYHMYGASVGTLNVYARFFFYRTKIWSKTGNQNNTWHLAQVEYTRPYTFQVLFEGVKGSSFTGDIAIDDFKLLDGSCPQIGDCDFEDGDLCTWTNSKSDDFDWIIGNGKTPSYFTGPAKDHTTGTGDGYYAFIESSSPRRTGDKSILESPTYLATNSAGRCISFWYHMYGGSIGTLNVRIKYLSQDGQSNLATQLLWQLKGNKGNNWLQGRIPIKSGSKYRLAFEAIRGTSYNGDIALDDIAITQSSCSFTPSTAWPTGITTKTPTPTTGPTRGPTAGNLGNDCNFQTSTCLWTMNSTARFKWLRHKRSTGSYGTGPTSDHTFGNSSGYYIYAEASYPALPNDTTWLKSGSIVPFGSAGKCLSFWYHQYGPHVGALRVNYKIASSIVLPIRLWQRIGTQGDRWNRGLVQLPVSTSNANVIFEAVRGVSYSGDIALDDISFLTGQCPPPSECTFENKQFCSWTQVTGSADQFDWSIGSGSTPSVRTGPKTDHTLQTSKGHYLYIETSSPRRRGDKAQLLSPQYNRPADKCFQFWYHMYGSTIGALRLFSQVSGSSNNLLWSKSGSQGNLWKSAQVTVTKATQPFKLLLEGQAGGSYTGDIAVDDVRITPGTCPLPGDCDFEAFGTCTYYQDQAEDTFDWVRASGGTSSVRTGPSIDNTKKTSSGHYMYIETSYPIKKGDKARLVSPDFNPTSSRGRCVKFAYHMYGSTIGALHVYIKTGAGNQSESLIWSISGNYGDQWILGQAPVRSSKKYTIVFEGLSGGSYTGDIAIDDISFAGFSCNCIPANAAPPTVRPTTLVPSDSNCTFEKGICYWRQLTTDNFDWTRYKGSTGSYGTGPLGDHTTGKGYYLYVETSYPRKENDTAIIESPPINPSISSICFSFWYHMHGAHVRELNVYRLLQGSSYKRKVWSRKGTQGNAWRYAQVDIITYRTFKVQMEAIRGISYQGDISIDDIVVSDKSCPPAKFCDFEDGTLCKWQNQRGDQFDWLRGDGGTPSIQTGPTTDHTTGTSTGNYLYIETSSPRRLGQKAWLYSQNIMRSPTGKCLNFWYHMYGSAIGKLNIYLDRAQGTPIWNRTGDQGNVWRHGRVTLKSYIKFKVIFEGVVGNSYRGDIAIDDVSIDDSPCPPPGSCNFEKGSLCTWINVANGNKTSQDDFDWQLNSGSTGSTGTGPSVDHTHGSSLGTYIYIETSGFNRRNGERARLESELFTGTAGKCLSFWYHMYGRSIGALNVYMKTNLGSALLKTYNGSQGNTWIEGEVGLHSAADFKVIFEGTRGSDYTGDISLDDIYVKDNNCVGLCSSVQPTARVKCGYDGIVPGTCKVSLGCCYDDSVPNVPYCFYHPSTCLAVPVNVRRQCGYASITRQLCQNRGCCYDPNSLGGVKCYHSLAATTAFPTTRPPITTPAPSPFDCTFEKGLCQFVNDINDDDFNWRRDSRGTPSVRTGPSADHTLGNRNGYYVYIETSYQTHNDTANLISPSINFRVGGNKVCIRFWFHMYGQHVDNLNVFLQTGSKLPALPIWTKNGTHGDKWRYAQIEVPRSPAFKAVFQGKRGPGYQGDIALDDISFVNGVCPPQLECDFESASICGYVQDVSDDFDWTLGQANTTSWNTGPPFDHTYRTKFGHYMHIEASHPVPGDRARLESPEHPATVGKCVEFYYHMYGAGMGTLRMFLRRGGKLDTTALWTLSGGQGYRWQRATVTVISQQNWKIVFEGIRGGDYRSDMAIDDIIIHNYACPAKGSCDFENGVCGYGNIDDDDFDWVRHSGGTTSISTGPSTDHTTGTNLGYYMYIEASAPRKADDRAHLVSETFKVGPEYKWCVSFWYHMYGVGSGALRLETRFKYPGYPYYYYHQFWMQQGNHGDNWLWAQATVTASYDFQFAFEAEVGGTPTYAGDIGLDDIRATPGKCPATTPTPSPNPCAVRCKNNQCVPVNKICDFVQDCGSSDDSDEKNCGGCDFESGTCKWADKSKGSFDWNRQQGSTSTVNTGPSSDHTKRNQLGYYMYVESSKGGAYNQAALQSPVLRQASANCRMDFWYHMYGSGIGTLRLYIVTGTRHTILWQISGNQGNSWKQATIYLMRRRQSYTMKIEAVRSYSSRGDIAVDDISLTGCQLPTPSASCYTGWYYQCGNRVCIQYDRLCDYTDDCGDNSDEANCPRRRFQHRCNFEWSLCWWSQLTDDQFNWTRSKGSTDSVGTGPLFDHTSGTNSGYYIYAESSYPRKKGDKARITSGNFQATRNTPCYLRFYYHMVGDHIGSLNIYVRNCERNGCPQSLVWSKNVSVGNYWVRHSIPIRSTKPFQVVIEAVRGVSYQGDIALDDAAFDDGCSILYGPLPTTAPPTTKPPTTPPCQTNQFYCGNGQCIDASKRCDFKNDCADGSDERNCGPCNFESGTCGYRDVSIGYYAWDRRSYTGNTDIGPVVDHTKKTANGYYMFVKRGGGSTYKSATLRSDKLPQTGANCVIQFYYYLNYTSGGGRLGVNFRHGGDSDDVSYILTTRQTTAGKWALAQSGVGARPSGWQLIFTGYKPFTAIDDVNFVNCTLPPNRGGQCGSTKVACSNGACITNNLRCDYANDCGDQSDENPQDCVLFKERCNFEGSLCNWYQNTDDDFDWKRKRGRTSSIDTGPGNDHTKGTRRGTYIYIETSSPRKPNDTARISSAPFRPAAASANCYLRFFYHMFGPHVNKLIVYQKTSQYFKSPMTPIWSRTGNQGDIWRRAEIMLKSSVNFQLVIEATRGTSYKGDIAIDDVSFTPGCQPDFAATLAPNPITVNPPPGCKSGEFKCTDGSCIHMSNLCNFRNDCGDNSDEARCPSTCNFEKDMCGWSNVQYYDRLDWTRHQGKTPSNGTGPLTDQTYKNSSGYYVYIEAGQRQRGYYPNAHLASPYYIRGARNCKLSFWYNMWHWTKGLDTRFNVLYRKNGRDTVLWTNIYQTANKWKKASMTLPNCPTDFRIVLEGRQYWRTKTDVAVDEIKFECAESIPPNSCAANNFQCTTTKQCIDQSTLCDYDRNCCDGSDETPDKCKGYNGNNFEKGFGSWIQLRNDDFDFTLQSGKTLSGGTGPKTDHTLQEEHGKYIYIEASSPRKQNDTARLAGPTISGSASRKRRAAGDCRMRFFYHMQGGSIGQLNIYTATYYGQRGAKVWSIKGNQGNQWNRGEVRLSNNADFQVIIEGIIGSSFRGDISLDDISFTPGCSINGGRLPGQPTPPVNPCGSGFFQCRKDLECIPRSHVCDFTRDCSDGADESASLCGYPCGFENGWCAFKNSHTDDYDWSLNTGNTSSSGTGPTGGDATGNKTGKYIYFEVSQRDVYKRADLISPTYGGSFADCIFTFFYHMKGRNVNGLFLRLHDINGTTVMWRLYNSQGDGWKKAEVSIGRRYQVFNLNFTGLVGNGWQGDIAIDQIDFANCSRPAACLDATGKFQCKSTSACIPMNKVCDITDDCGDGSDEDKTLCASYFGYTFENCANACNWTQLKDDDFDWKRNKGLTPSINTGPTRDHTYGTALGYYMYLETSGQKANTRARLGSIKMHALAGGSCQMRFFYHMFGRHVSSLNVYVKRDSSTVYFQKYTTTGQLGDRWIKAVIDLSTETKMFAVVIEGVRGKSYQGDIAIDDITFTPDCITNGSRPVFPTLPPICGTDQFQCVQDRMCISKSKRCDKSSDCHDGSDEIGCSVSPKTGKQSGSQLTKQSGVVAAGVVGAIVLILIVILVSYLITKRRREKKLHLFSVFYDPTKQQGEQGSSVPKGVSIKGAEGVTNPVYDERPMDDYDMDSNMFADDTFAVPSESIGGATSMANPLYQDPYTEDDDSPLSQF